MLSFEVRSLAKAVNVEGELVRSDGVWLDGDVLPDDAVRVVGRLSAAGPGRFYFHGHLAGTTTLECTRCLTPVAVRVTADAAVIFSDESTDDGDDPDVYPLAEGGTRIDLRPAVREQWLLNAPVYVQCREECRGICATCGADLNAGACSCAPTTDRRWDALRTARSRAD